MFTRFFKQRKASQSASPPEASQTDLSVGSQERRHREDVPYVLPKDLEEGQRLNLQHYIFRYALRGNYAAPLPETISAILDVGSGTGIWCQEMAQLFPTARIFGLDLELQPIPLNTSATEQPANYQFVQGDLLKGLPFPDGMFDYAHQRMLVMGIPLQNWPQVIRELARVTRPGGWVEVLELGTDIHPAGPTTTQLLTWSLDLLKARGIDSSQMSNLGTMLTQNGLNSVTSLPLDIPLGAWDPHLGTLLEKDILAAFRTLKSAVSQREGMSPERFEQYLQEAAQEWKRDKSVYRFYLAYGQV